MNMAQLSTERKNCAYCERSFPRNPKLSEQQWEKTLYCSRTCFGRRISQPILMRIFANVEIDRISYCWIWKGARDSHGYGLIHFDGKSSQKLHRVVYQLAIGSIPQDMLVLHRCDNRPCCNPLHLFLGTTQDNVDDMRLKNRQHYLNGEIAPGARLTEKDVQAIRNDERTQEAIARDYGVAQTTISAIKRGKNWKHVREDET